MRKPSRLDSQRRIMSKHVNFSVSLPGLKSPLTDTLRSFTEEENGFSWKHLECK